MVNKIKINNKAVTLIELVVALAILLIVLVLSFSIFIFNLRSFERGEIRSEVQNDVRMVSDLITYEIRNARDISFDNASLSEDLNLSEIQSKYKSIDFMSFEIIEEDSHFFLEYKIIGYKDKYDTKYEVSSKVFLNNIGEDDFDILNEVTTGETLYYSKDI